MHNTTYVATAPDGSRHTRTTHRTSTHAVLDEGTDGWEAVGFCGSLDLAEKKRAEHPGSIVVEGLPSTDEDFGAELAGDDKDETAEEVEPTAPDADNTPEQPKRTIGGLVEGLLMDEGLD